MAGANRHDAKQCKAVLDDMVVYRPNAKKKELHLSEVRAYRGEVLILVITAREYILHIKQ